MSTAYPITPFSEHNPPLCAQGVLASLKRSGAFVRATPRPRFINSVGQRSTHGRSGRSPCPGIVDGIGPNRCGSDRRGSNTAD
jgi:hypothetical protein